MLSKFGGLDKDRYQEIFWDDTTNGRINALKATMKYRLQDWLGTKVVLDFGHDDIWVGIFVGDQQENYYHLSDLCDMGLIGALNFTVCHPVGLSIDVQHSMSAYVMKDSSNLWSFDPNVLEEIRGALIHNNIKVEGLTCQN
jgi:hypothetical protein